MPTTTRGLEYPASTDAPRVWEDMQALAESADTAIGLLEHDGTSDTSIGTVAANFTSVSQVGRTALDGKLVTLTLEITSTNTITATSGNIADTLCFTLDAEYRPSETISVLFGANMLGEASITAAGAVTLRAASDNLTAGTTFRLTATFLRA